MPKKFVLMQMFFVFSFVCPSVSLAQAPPCAVRQELTARGPGVVSKYLVASGSTVKKGQIIVEFDSRMIRAGFKDTKAVVDAAKGNEELALDASRRFEKLKGSEAVTEQQIVEARIKVKQANAAKRQAEAALERMKVQVEDTVIRSEINGVVRGLPSILGLPVQIGQSLGSIENDSCQPEKK